MSVEHVAFGRSDARLGRRPARLQIEQVQTDLADLPRAQRQEVDGCLAGS
jgi:hypothetical protein